MVRPGLKRLQESRWVNVIPNKTGTTNNTGRSVLFRKSGNGVSRKNIIFSEQGNAEGSTKLLKKVTPSYTEEEKLKDRLCMCVKKNYNR
ncbi:uncharacterized protein METZ01_LOCUS464460 [marine metagenome]|uniref:Uncharacterized protein n=1 Tax=marine metagenome TaxID=408172 RepID=A0A383AUH5_9ZZZZ